MSAGATCGSGCWRRAPACSRAAARTPRRVAIGLLGHQGSAKNVGARALPTPSRHGSRAAPGGRRRRPRRASGPHNAVCADRNRMCRWSRTESAGAQGAVRIKRTVVPTHRSAALCARAGARHANTDTGTRAQAAQDGERAPRGADAAASAAQILCELGRSGRRSSGAHRKALSSVPASSPQMSDVRALSRKSAARGGRQPPVARAIARSRISVSSLSSTVKGMRRPLAHADTQRRAVLGLGLLQRGVRAVVVPVPGLSRLAFWRVRRWVRAALTVGAAEIARSADRHASVSV